MELLEESLVSGLIVFVGQTHIGSSDLCTGVLVMTSDVTDRTICTNVFRGHLNS